MILTCPTCSARYLVPATAFSDGPRVVRCARCNHAWEADLPNEVSVAVSAMQAEVMPPEAAEPEAEQKQPVAEDQGGVPDAHAFDGPAAVHAIEAAASQPAAEIHFRPHKPKATLPVRYESPRERLMKRVAMLLAALGVGALLAFFFVEREMLVSRWPELEMYYTALGFSIESGSEGLSLENVQVSRHYESGAPFLDVKGEIRNMAERTVDVPSLTASAVGADGQVIRSWKIDVPASKLKADERVPFTSSVPAPPGTVAELTLHFVNERHEHKP